MELNSGASRIEVWERGNWSFGFKMGLVMVTLPGKFILGVTDKPWKLLIVVPVLVDIQTVATSMTKRILKQRPFP